MSSIVKLINNKYNAEGETSASGERMLLQVITGERRKHRRYFFPVLIECCRSRTGTNDMFRALIFNYSGRGLCIRLDRPIGEGEKIEVVGCIYPSFYGTATVRWLNKTGEDFYVVGLAYDPTK